MRVRAGALSAFALFCVLPGCLDSGDDNDEDPAPRVDAAPGTGGTGDAGGPDAATGGTTLVNTPGPRQGHSATLLEDGRVLVVGGFGTATSEQESWLFDPATNAFTAGPAISPRNSHAAVRLPDGRVLIAGGRSGQGAGGMALFTAMVFDPATDAFSDVDDVNGAVGTRGAFVVQSGPDAGRVLMLASPDNENYVAEVFDPATGSFSVKAGATAPLVFGPTATALDDGRILLAGGQLPSGTRTDTALLYDPTTHAFAATAGVMSEAKVSMAAARLASGDVMHFAGFSAAIAANQTTEVFDADTETFTAGPVWKTASALPSMVQLPDGRVLLMNGNEGALVYVFDPATNEFSEHPRRMSMRLSLFSATLLQDGRVLTVGGQGNLGFIVGEAELFLP